MLNRYSRFTLIHNLCGFRDTFTGCVKKNGQFIEDPTFVGSRHSFKSWDFSCPICREETVLLNYTSTDVPKGCVMPMAEQSA
jgi:hypothetical protein